MWKNKSGPLSYTINKINPTWIRLVKLETVKLLEQNINSTLFSISLSNVFIGSSGKGRRSNTKQMGLHQNKRHLHGERNQQ